MSMYHVLGISHDGKLDQITDSDSKDDALAAAPDFVKDYRQMFLAKSGQNVRELKIVPPPLVLEG